MLFRTILTLGLMLLTQFPSFAEEIPIEFMPSFGQPYVQSGEIMVDAAEYNTLMFEIEANQKGTARLFWINHYNMEFSQPKSLWFTIRPGKHKYYFNVPSQNINWIGWVRGLLINSDSLEVHFKVAEAKAVKGNLITNIRSAWQEFWGPKGRQEIGTSINVTPSSTIFGRSINIYFYCLIAIFFFIILVLNLIKAGGFNHILSKTIQQTFILAIFFSILLALNSNFNYFALFKENYAKYYGKSIEEKRAATYGMDFHEFLVFAKQNLPEQPVEFSLLTEKYMGGLQARIYLVPHIFIENPEKKVPYLLIFNPASDQNFDEKDYTLLAKFGDNKYILKREK